MSAAALPVKEAEEAVPQDAVIEEDEGKEEVELSEEEKADTETEQGGAEVAVVQQAPVQAATEAVKDEGEAVTEGLVERMAGSDVKLLKTAGAEGEEASPEFQLLKAQTAPETQKDAGREGAGNQVATQVVTPAAQAPEAKTEAGKTAQPGGKAESESYYAIQRALEAVDEAPRTEVAPQAQAAPAAPQAKPEGAVKTPNPMTDAALAQGMAARLIGGSELAAQQGPTKGAEGSNGVTVAGLGNQANAEKLVNTKAKSAAALPSKDQQAVVDKVKELLQKAIQTRDGNSITVKLNPQELGQMTVKVTQRESQVYARIIPESPEVEQVLRARAPEVMQVLVAAGLKPDQVHVSIGRERTDAEAFQFQQFMGRSDSGAKQDGKEAKGETMSGGMWTLGGSEIELEEFVESGWVA